MRWMRSRSRACSTSTLVFLQPTSPFIDSADLDAAIELVRDGSHDSVFSAVETYGFLWALSADGAARGVNHDPSVRPRRQDREPEHLETGAFYVMDAAGFRAARHRFFGRVGLVEVAERTAIEIDSEEQLAMAQAIAVQFHQDTELMDVAAVVTDFDGVHTDDTALLDADGREHVRVSRSDGMGVARLRRAGIPVLILSTETDRWSPRARGSSRSTSSRQWRTRRRPSASGSPIGAFRSPGSHTSETMSTTCPASNWSAGRWLFPMRTLSSSPPRASSPVGPAAAGP